MAETNYLNIFRLMISKPGNPDTVPFKDFYKYFNPEDRLTDEQVFKNISEAYVTSFDNKFIESKSGKRALTAKINLVKRKSGDRIIHGFVEGGITDANFETYQKNNNQIAEDQISTEEVLSQPYYFLLWMPKDSNLGIAMLQSNDSVNRGVISAFFDHLEKFFSERDFKIDKNPITPKKVSDEYYSNSTVRSIEVIQYKTNSNFITNTGTLKTVKITHTISGFKITHEALLKGLIPQRSKMKIIRDIIGLEDDEVIDKVNITVSDGTTTRTGTVEQSNFIIRIEIKDLIIEKNDTGINNLFNFVKPYFEMTKREITGS